MGIKEKDIKLLWGRSGAHCAICRIPVSFDSATSTVSFPLGEQAHIVAEEPTGPRGDSILSRDERNAYHNLILLCPNDHIRIDKDQASFPVEKLHQIKAEHELWVQSTLSEKIDRLEVARDTIYAALIDAATEGCRLSDWKVWTSGALEADARWDLDAQKRINAFAHKVLAAVWPGTLEELERSLRTLSLVMHQANGVFMRHARRIDDSYIAERFYSTHVVEQEEYDRNWVAYNQWVDECHSLIREATKTANWFADVVRRDINPMYFALEGKFLIEEGPFLDFSWRTTLLEYTQEEKEKLPEDFITRVHRERPCEESAPTGPTLGLPRPPTAGSP